MLWGEHQPRTARNLVQMYVGELRVLLGATTVRFRTGGYVLELPARRLDLAEFDDLAEQAYREGKTERALRLLVEALRCWRGGVLADAGTRLRQHPRAVAAEQGRIAAAVALADLANSLDCPAVAGEAICLNNLGDTTRRLGQLDTAIEHLERALSLQRRADDRAGFQYTLHSLGDVHHDIGHYEQAVQYYQEAIATTRALGDQRKLARSLSQLARTLDTIGDIQAARQYRQQALEILETLGDDQADALRELMNSHDDRAD